MRRIWIVALAMLFSGCALMSKFGEMTPKQKALWYMRAFNAEYMDVCQQAQYYDLMPEKAQQIIRWRARLLKELYPLISSYIMSVEKGIDPGQAAENAITELFNRLMAVDPADVAANAPPPPEPQPGRVAGVEEDKGGLDG